MDIREYFGIYPDDLQKVEKYCKRILKKFGCEKDLNLIYEFAKDDIYSEKIDYDLGITDNIIFCIFRQMKIDLEMKLKTNVEYEIDIDDVKNSKLYIDGILAEEYNVEVKE